MPIISGPAGMDPILGRMRTKDIQGGTASGNYTFNSAEFTVGITGLVSLNQVPGNKVSGTASVEDVQTGGAQRLVDVTALRGALSAGQAVDVTSQPDGVTGDYKGTFSVTGSLGFASFPKYASSLNYLMIADLTATTSGTVTPSGTWLDGTATAKSLAAGTSTRVAMLFDAANKAKFTFASTGSVSVSHCREYEVTACSAEAVAYIAALSNPDAFASYYLIKADMVQPWTYIIDMGTSPAVTIASGLSYKLNATGTHQLTVDTCPAGYDGRDAIIRIRLGGSGVIQAVAPLQLGGALVPYAINNCVVRFRDGEAVLLVEDTLAGYIVTANSGTGEGSLPYGLAATNVPYIAFSPSTDGTPIDISGATTAAEDVMVVGNGYAETIISGGINCTSKTTFANLAMNGVIVSSGTLTLGDVYIPNGATVAVNGGGLAVEKVTGNGGVIDLGGTNLSYGNGSSGTISGVAITGATAGGFSVIGTGRLTLSGCSFFSNSNIAAFPYAGAGRIGYGAIVEVADCTFGTGQGMVITKDDAGSTTLKMNGSNSFLGLIGGGGYMVVSSGAIVDLTGNTNSTPINPGGGVTFAPGGATVYPSAGQASAYMLGGMTVPTIGNTNVVNLGGKNVIVALNGSAYASGVIISGGNATSGGAFLLSSGAQLELHSVELASNTVTGFGGAIVGLDNNTILLDSCYVHDNTNITGILWQGGWSAVTYIQGSTIGTNQRIYIPAGKCILAGSNLFTAILNGAGSCVISSGAIVDLTGNSNATPIAPGGGVYVSGGCTVINSAGASVSIAGGTYTKINNDGTTA